MEAVGRIHTVAVSVNSARYCNAAEISNIARLRDSAVKIDQWVSYVRPHDLPARDRFLPEKVTRFSLPPEASPLGDRFIMLGGMLETEGAEVFDTICRVNSRRMKDIEFIFPSDAIGGPNAPYEHEKLVKAVDPRNDLNRTLNLLWGTRGVGSILYYDDQPLGQLKPNQSMPTLFVRWLITTQEIIERLSEGMPVS